MNKLEKLSACKVFFQALAEELKDSYETLGSCNKDNSVYLVPNGTTSEVTYYGKPKKSFRVSDHWNWYSSEAKCSWLNYIQCLSVDMPRAKKREAEGKASKPIYGCQVAMIGDDGKYHHVYGERFDRNSRSWVWDDSADISEIARRLRG